MRAIRRRLFQSAADNLRDPLIADLARSPGARFIVETVEPALGKAPTPAVTWGRAASLDTLTLPSRSIWRNDSSEASKPPPCR